MTSITIEVDQEIKIAFEEANPEIKQQLSSIITTFFKQNLSQKTLIEVMAEISDKAQARGLTPEILEEILTDND